MSTGFSWNDTEEVTEIKQFYDLESLDPNEWIVTSNETQPSLTPSLDIQPNYRLKQDEVDALGLFGSISLIVQDSNCSMDQLSLMSPSFDPKEYLRIIHRTTDRSDLIKGRDQLLNLYSAESSNIRKLVVDNFDRFISALKMIGNIHSHMKKTIFEDKTLHRFKEVKRKIAETKSYLQSYIDRAKAFYDSRKKLNELLNFVNQNEEFFDITPKIIKSIENVQLYEFFQLYKASEASILLMSSNESDESKLNLVNNVSKNIKSIVGTNIENICKQIVSIQHTNIDIKHFAIDLRDNMFEYFKTLIKAKFMNIKKLLKSQKTPDSALFVQELVEYKKHKILYEKPENLAFLNTVLNDIIETSTSLMEDIQETFNTLSKEGKKTEVEGSESLKLFELVEMEFQEVCIEIKTIRPLNQVYLLYMSHLSWYGCCLFPNKPVAEDFNKLVANKIITFLQNHNFIEIHIAFQEFDFTPQSLNKFIELYTFLIVDFFITLGNFLANTDTTQLRDICAQYFEKLIESFESIRVNEIPKFNFLIKLKHLLAITKKSLQDLFNVRSTRQFDLLNQKLDLSIDSNQQLLIETKSKRITKILERASKIQSSNKLEDSSEYCYEYIEEIACFVADRVHYTSERNSEIYKSILYMTLDRYHTIIISNDQDFNQLCQLILDCEFIKSSLILEDSKLNETFAAIMKTLDYKIVDTLSKNDQLIDSDLLYPVLEKARNSSLLLLNSLKVLETKM